MKLLMRVAMYVALSYVGAIVLKMTLFIDALPAFYFLLFVSACMLFYKATLPKDPVETLGTDGKIETWHYKCTAFSLLIDFKKQTAKLFVARPEYVLDMADKDNLQKHKEFLHGFDRTFPLVKFEYEGARIIKEEVFAPNVGYGTTSDGKTVQVRMPGGRSYEKETSGRQMSFKHTPLIVKEIGENDGLMVNSDWGNILTIRTAEANAKTAEHFGRHWEKISAMIAEAENAFRAEIGAKSDKIKADMKAKYEATREEKERERISKRDEASRIATARWNELAQQAGVTGEFHAWWVHPADAVIEWSVAADRNGKGLIIVGDEVWMGSFTGAKAKIMSSKPADWTSSNAHLELELVDPTYEQKYLKKRRMTIMNEADMEDLNEWCDRINLLSTKSYDQPPAAQQ